MNYLKPQRIGVVPIALWLDETFAAYLQFLARRRVLLHSKVNHTRPVGKIALGIRAESFAALSGCPERASALNPARKARALRELRKRIGTSLSHTPDVHVLIIEVTAVFVITRNLPYVNLSIHLRAVYYEIAYPHFASKTE